MTDDDALHEARERWGIEAAVRHRQADLQDGQKAYAVGVCKDYLFIIMGRAIRGRPRLRKPTMNFVDWALPKLASRRPIKSRTHHGCG